VLGWEEVTKRVEETIEAATALGIKASLLLGEAWEAPLETPGGLRKALGLGGLGEALSLGKALSLGITLGLGEALGLGEGLGLGEALALREGLGRLREPLQAPLEPLRGLGEALGHSWEALVVGGLGLEGLLGLDMWGLGLMLGLRLGPRTWEGGREARQVVEGWSGEAGGCAGGYAGAGARWGSARSGGAGPGAGL